MASIFDHPDFNTVAERDRKARVYNALTFINHLNSENLHKLLDYVEKEINRTNDTYYHIAKELIADKIAEHYERIKTAPVFNKRDRVVVTENRSEWTQKFDDGPYIDMRGFVIDNVGDGEARVFFPRSETDGPAREYLIPNYALRKLTITERIEFFVSRIFWSMERF